MESRDTEQRSNKLICPNCGHISEARTPVVGLLQAFLILAAIPAIVSLIALGFGVQAAQQSSTIMAIGALGLVALAIQRARADLKRSTECQSCVARARLVPLESDEGRRIAREWAERRGEVGD